MNNIKKWVFIGFFGIATAFAGAYLNSFTAKSEGENVRVEWRTGQENNVKDFIIQRKTPQSSFADIVTIKPTGDNSYYTYLDEAVYKASDLVFIYRLKILDNNGQVTYSDEASVVPNISGVKRTWGSIKAMFR